MAVAGPDHAGTSVPALTEARNRKANDRPNAIRTSGRQHGVSGEFAGLLTALFCGAGVAARDFGLRIFFTLWVISAKEVRTQPQQADIAVY